MHTATPPYLTDDPRLIHSTEDGTPTVFDPRTKAYFHSQHGAVAEARHVYLGASNLKQRLAAQPVVRVLEIGFGTGLNFTLTAQMARAESSVKLQYWALEPIPLSKPILREYHRRLRTPPEWADIIEAFPTTGTIENVTFNLMHLALSHDLRLGADFDILYYDPFGPHSAPEMWAWPMLDAAFSHLRPNGVLCTFSVTGDFKRYLKARQVPFAILPGFGRKREMMLAGGGAGFGP